MNRTRPYYKVLNVLLVVVLVLAWNWYDAIVESFAGLDARFVHPLQLT